MSEKCFINKVALPLSCVYADVAALSCVLQVGCPVLALEVLSKIPKVTKKSGSAPLSKGSSVANARAGSAQPVENGTLAAAAGMDWGFPSEPTPTWGFPSEPTPAWGATDSAGGLDWSQPLVQIEDDGLQLDWGKDKDEDEDEEEDEEDDGGLTMKKPETKAEPVSQTLKEEAQVRLMFITYDQCL